jgi:hypothetical protein
MSRMLDETAGSESHAGDEAQSASSGLVNGTSTEQRAVQALLGAALSSSEAVAEQVRRAVGWTRERPHIGLGAAAVVALTATVATRAYLEHRAMTRMSRPQRLGLWIRGTPADIRRAEALVPIASVSGTLLTTALVRRLRHTESANESAQLKDRLAGIGANIKARHGLDAPHGHPTLLGHALGSGRPGLLANRGRWRLVR